MGATGYGGGIKNYKVIFLCILVCGDGLKSEVSNFCAMVFEMFCVFVLGCRVSSVLCLKCF